jgi:hypothetical protein
VKLADNVWLRAGQWKRPFSRQQIGSSGRLELTDRSITDKAFGAGRDIGLAVHNNYEKSPDLEWALGVFNGTGDGARLVPTFNGDGEVTGGTPQMGFVQNDDLIEDLAPDRADHALDVGGLPGRSRRGQDFRDRHGRQAFPNDMAIGAIAIPDEISRRCVPRKRLDDLLCDPDRGRALRDTDMDDPAAVMAQDDETIQEPERGGRDNEQVHGREAVGVVLKERPPSLGRRLLIARHVPAH